MLMEKIGRGFAVKGALKIRNIVGGKPVVIDMKWAFSNP